MTSSGIDFLSGTSSLDEAEDNGNTEGTEGNGNTGSNQNSAGNENEVGNESGEGRNIWLINPVEGGL